MSAAPELGLASVLMTGVEMARKATLEKTKTPGVYRRGGRYAYV